MKRLLAICLALLLVLSFSVTAFAADDDPTTYTVTVSKDSTDKAAHTYGAYQLFTGDLDPETKTLSNIQWGTNVTPATLITELNKAPLSLGLAADATAVHVAKAISDKNMTADGTDARALAEAFNTALTGNPVSTVNVAADATSGELTGLVAGYYLIKDTAAVSGEGAETRYILQVVDNVTPNEKATVPSVDKSIIGPNDEPVCASDNKVGDEIKYQIKGTLPSTFEDYKAYTTYTFTDTMSKGLTPPAAADVKVFKGTNDITSLFDVAITDGENGAHVLTVSLKQDVDLRTVTDPVSFANSDEILVKYSAILNSDAVIGSDGNPNVVDLEFSNDPNSSGDGTGKTPEDKVTVFTFEVKALKVEPDGNETITQEAYNALTDAEKENYIQIGTDKYQKVKALTGAGFTLYKKNGSEWIQIGNEIASGSTFEFKQIDSGDYKLVESTVPTGYNKIDDILFTVTATYDTDNADKEPELKSLTVTPSDSFAVSVTTKADEEHITTDGIISTKILNEKGSVLPSTGGIGTTIFYVVGGMMVAAAGVLLITKKRMSKEG